MIQINQKTDKRLFMQSSLCALSALFGLSAVYADDYPNRPIKLVVPFPPGGSTDVTGRAIGTKLALRLNQAVVIENKPGGNATIGARAVLNSSADGYTLFYSGGTSVTTIFNPPASAIDLMRDFMPVAPLMQGGFGLFINASLPVSNLRELIAHVKANPNKLNYGMANPPTTLAMESFRARVGLPMVGIPYKGSNPSTLALLSNEIQVVMDNPISMLAHVKSGKIKALAVGSTKRMQALPEVPLFSDVVPGFTTLWNTGVWARAGTPAAVIEKLNKELNAILPMQDIQDLIVAAGGYSTGGTPEDFRRMAQAELDFLSTSARAIDFKPE